MTEYTKKVKEKAKELGNKFYQGSFFDYDKEGHIEECERAKERAIKCVDEILDVVFLMSASNWEEEYWQKVKEEIKKL